MKSLLIIVFFIIAICSCNVVDKESFVAPSRNIDGKIIMDKDSSLMIGERCYLTVINNDVYIYNPWGGYFFTKYDIANDIAYRFCRQGQGPGEFLNAVPEITQIALKDSNYISVFDNAFHKFILFEENQTLDNSNVKEVFLKGEEAMIIGAFQINDSIVFATGVFEKNICGFYKHGIRQEVLLESFTKVGADNHQKRIFKDANKFDLSPNKEFLVRITQNGGLIEAYKIENMQLIQQFSNAYFDVICDYKLSDTRNSRYGYIDVSISNNKIYGLYDGGLVARENTFRSNEVHVYDMKGILIEKLILDQYVRSIGVNNEETQLYAISRRELDLLLYNLN